MQRSVLWLSAALALGCSAAASATATAPPVRAIWQKHSMDFGFVGFTTHYSCGGFEDKVDQLLAAAGARSDAKTSAACMAPMGGPERISTARLTFHVLVPAPATSGANGRGAARIVPAEWKTVHLLAHSLPGLGEGDCELVERFAVRILPLFTVRDVHDNVNCVPQQVNLGSVDLKFRVLVAVPKKAHASPAQR
ncbi:MAG TPA: hypothetical protein VMV25_04335 [Steroidobacteraceae bacterium]|nr:hypothetical protein [Steroidobacteraceae bacterium]